VKSPGVLIDSRAFLRLVKLRRLVKTMRVARIEVWALVLGIDRRVFEIHGTKEQLIEQILPLLPGRYRSEAIVSSALDQAIWTTEVIWFANHSMGVKIISCKTQI